MTGNTPVQGDFCPQTWVWVSFSHLTTWPEENQMNATTKSIRFIKNPSKPKRKNYIPPLPYSPGLLSTNSLLEWRETSYKDNCLIIILSDPH